MSAWTLAFQVVNFLILAAVLYRFLFKPVQKMIARRQAEIENASKAAEAIKRAAEADRAQYQQQSQKLCAERDTLLTEARGAMTEERERVLSQARAEADGIRSAARAEMDQERNDAVQELAGQAVTLAADIAARLLEQVASTRFLEAFLRQLCEHLEHLPADKLRELREELSERVSPIVATSPALDLPQQTEWSKRIAEDLGTHGSVTFITDAELVAGAELRLPHTSISFSWRDGLTRARAELGQHANGR